MLVIRESESLRNIVFSPAFFYDFSKFRVRHETRRCLQGMPPTPPVY